MNNLRPKNESLARYYRPKTFEEICGQDSIIKILKRQLDLKEFKNTYLFCGSSGCGKTTTARAFANAINNGVGNPIEIDAASNNGVENVRNLIKTASERAVDSEYKIIIIDECHSLTSQAWQAFLKCIEEPPTYTIFIFCTTDPQKIPATILNRVMRFNFNKISTNLIAKRLEEICKIEGFINYFDACDYISKICNGQMRDGIALLDKCASYCEDLTIENVFYALGDYSYDLYFSLINQIIDGDTCIFSFDTLFSIIQQDLEEPSVYYFHILSIHVIVVFYSIIYFIKFLVSLSLSLQNQNIHSYQNYSVFTSFLNTIIYRSSSYFNS